MDASIIIINWNTRDLLIECINSVYSTTRGINFDIWVVDNGSSDGSVQALRELFPDVNVIENQSNLGFAKACNQALKLMESKFAILLNSDTILTDGAIKTVLDTMEKDPDIGLCGAQLLNPDGTKQNSIANTPSLATELLNKSLLRRLFPQKYPGKERDFAEPIEVESIIGAFMAVRKEAMDEVGMLDESYFFFFEETDWCIRMKKKGWKVVHHPGAKVYHLQGQTVRKIKYKGKDRVLEIKVSFF